MEPFFRTKVRKVITTARYGQRRRVRVGRCVRVEEKREKGYTNQRVQKPAVRVNMCACVYEREREREGEREKA